jgi:ABC-type amino acid transport substrate-binding protein
LQVVIMPVSRDDLLPYLLDGKGDIAAANLTITPARQAQVAFSDPTYPGVRELVVTGPAAPDVASLDDLASSELHIRKSSSYFEHLSGLNQEREAAGQAVIHIVEADEVLEDYDLLELVNAGLIPAIIVDSHKAALWAQVFENITVHQDLAIHEGGSIAWAAVRKDNPKLLEAVNGFVKGAKKGTLLGNILIKRYLTGTDWIDDVRSGAAQKRYEATVDIIKKYAGQYDFDWLMIVAARPRHPQQGRRRWDHAGPAQHGRGSECRHRQHRRGRCQRACRREVPAFPARPLLRFRGDRPPGPGTLVLCRLQRRAGEYRQGAEEGRRNGPRPERLVRRAGDRRRPDRQPRAGALRPQHLQVLRGLQEDRRASRTAAIGGSATMINRKDRL